MNNLTKPLPFFEFIILMALMVSLVAMSIDITLPALSVIGSDLKVFNKLDSQYIVTALFFGFGLGQLFAGPLSDCFGRKPLIYLGYCIFISGCSISMLASDFSMMLVGRVLQGVGAAAPRVIPIAIVRDGYSGRMMARVISFIMTVFILVPAVAPFIGQWLLLASGWRSIFVFLLLTASGSFIWFALRQPETLLDKKRRKFNWSKILFSIRENLCSRSFIGYTVSLGMVSGAFIAYLATARQIFQDIFFVGELFPYYFGAVAISIGVGYLINSKLVLRFGMRFLTMRGLFIAGSSSIVLSVVLFIVVEPPPIWVYLAWLLSTFCSMGFVLANLNALAIEPLGHIAGLSAAIIGFSSTLIAIPLSILIGAHCDGTVLPLVTGFAILNFLALGLIYCINAGSKIDFN